MGGNNSILETVMYEETPMMEQLIRQSGAPEEMMDQLWFRVFCANFAHSIIKLIEGDLLQ
jgi:hypothetical protein